MGRRIAAIALALVALAVIFVLSQRYQVARRSTSGCENVAVVQAKVDPWPDSVPTPPGTEKLPRGLVPGAITVELADGHAYLLNDTSSNEQYANLLPRSQVVLCS